MVFLTEHMCCTESVVAFECLHPYRWKDLLAFGKLTDSREKLNGSESIRWKVPLNKFWFV